MWIYLAVNHSLTGNPLGGVHVVNFGDLLTITGNKITCERIDDHHLKIGEEVYSIDGYAIIPEKRAWDAALVEIGVANQITNDLMKHKDWHVVMAGNKDLFDAWFYRNRIDLREALVG